MFDDRGLDAIAGDEHGRCAVEGLPADSDAERGALPAARGVNVAEPGASLLALRGQGERQDRRGSQKQAT